MKKLLGVLLIAMIFLIGIPNIYAYTVRDSSVPDIARSNNSISNITQATDVSEKVVGNVITLFGIGVIVLLVVAIPVILMIVIILVVTKGKKKDSVQDHHESNIK
ncbi:MAG: hypothetical protein Q4D02_02085 [Clostridia bacterium]|nr:hypothetical protein [Clostridia bacterium]